MRDLDSSPTQLVILHLSIPPQNSRAGRPHHWLALADPRAGSKTERVIDAVEDGIWLANQIYEQALLRFGQGNIDYKW